MPSRRLLTTARDSSPLELVRCYRAVPVAVVGPLTGRGAVVEQRDAGRVDLHPAGDALCRAEKDPGRRRVGRRPPVPRTPRPAGHLAHDQEIVHHEPTGGSVPGGLDHHGAGNVPTVMGNGRVGGSKPERTGAPIEQGPEDAGRVRSGQAQPLDRSVRGDEAIVLAVGKEGVLGDRGKITHCRVLLVRRVGKALSIRKEASTHMSMGWVYIGWRIRGSKGNRFGCLRRFGPGQ